MSIIKKSALFLGIITLFSACLENSMPDLEILDRSYLIQTNSPNPYFQPYIGIYSNYELELDAVTVTKDGKKLTTSFPSYYYFEAFSSSAMSLSEANGTYEVKVVSQKKGSIETGVDFNFSESEILGQFQVNEFSFKDDYINASWEEVKNANYFGIIVEPVYRTEDGSALYIRNQNHLSIFPDSTSHMFNNNTMRMNLSTYGLTKSDSVRITLVAAYVNKDNKKLLVKGTQKHLRGELNSFTEDETEEEEE